MRPGQTAPECKETRGRLKSRRSSFNEAGADCPGMLAETGHSSIIKPGFNEAGADCPGMPCRRDANTGGYQHASMRPGQTAPECGGCRCLASGASTSFNEAGADCPGMPAHAPPPFRVSFSGFNEAGADCPGMPLARALPVPKSMPASMRPGQTAPECRGGPSQSQGGGWPLQ